MKSKARLEHSAAAKAEADRRIACLEQLLADECAAREEDAKRAEAAVFWFSL
jgi:hypothetical protein